MGCNISKLCKIEYGVPQGSVLGPLLFSLYVNDLPNVSNFETTLFADDTNLHIFHNNINILQSVVKNEIKKIDTWMKLNKLIRGEVEYTRLEAKDTKNFKARNRPSRGQGPRTQAQVFSKTNRSSKIFSGDLHLRETKKGLRKFFARFLAFSNKISTVQKIVLSSSRGQGNFRGLEASRPRPRTSKCVLSWTTSSRPRTSTRTPPLKLPINYKKAAICLLVKNVHI